MRCVTATLLALALVHGSARAEEAAPRKLWPKAFQGSYAEARTESRRTGKPIVLVLMNPLEEPASEKPGESLQEMFDHLDAWLDPWQDPALIRTVDRECILLGRTFKQAPELAKQFQATERWNLRILDADGTVLGRLDGSQKPANVLKAIQKAIAARNEKPDPEDPPAPAKGKVEWFSGSWEAARAESRRTGRLLFVFWRAPSGPWAEPLERDTFTDGPLAGLMNAECVNVKIDGERSRELAEDLEIALDPTILILDTDGTHLGRIHGMQQPPAVLKLLRAALAARKPAAKPGDIPIVSDPAERPIPGDLPIERVLPGVLVKGFAASGTIVRFASRLAGASDLNAPPPPAGVKLVYVTDSDSTRIPEFAERVVVDEEYYRRLMRALAGRAVISDNQFSFVFDRDGKQIAKCVGLKHRLQDLYAFCRAVSSGYLSLNKQEPGSALARPDEDPFTNSINGFNVFPDGKVAEGLVPLVRGQRFLIVVSGDVTLANEPGHTYSADGAFVTAARGRYAVPGKDPNPRVDILHVDYAPFEPEEKILSGIYHAVMPGHGIKCKGQITRQPVGTNFQPGLLRIEVLGLQDVDLSEPEVFPEKPAGAKLVQMFDVWANSDKKVTSEKLAAGRRYVVEVTGTIELAPAVSSLKVHADAAYIREVGDRRSKFWKKEPAKASTLFVDGNAFEPREDANGSSSYSWRVSGADRALVFSIHDPHDDDLANNQGAVTVTIWDAGEGAW